MTNLGAEEVSQAVLEDFCIGLVTRDRVNLFLEKTKILNILAAVDVTAERLGSAAGAGDGECGDGDARKRLTLLLDALSRCLQNFEIFEETILNEQAKEFITKACQSSFTAIKKCFADHLCRLCDAGDKGVLLMERAGLLPVLFSFLKSEDECVGVSAEMALSKLLTTPEGIKKFGLLKQDLHQLFQTPNNELVRVRVLAALVWACEKNASFRYLAMEEQTVLEAALSLATGNEELLTQMAAAEYLQTFSNIEGGANFLWTLGIPQNFINRIEKLEIGSSEFVLTLQIVTPVVYNNPALCQYIVDANEGNFMKAVEEAMENNTYETDKVMALRFWSSFGRSRSGLELLWTRFPRTFKIVRDALEGDDKLLENALAALCLVLDQPGIALMDEVFLRCIQDLFCRKAVKLVVENVLFGKRELMLHFVISLIKVEAIGKAALSNAGFRTFLSQKNTETSLNASRAKLDLVRDVLHLYGDWLESLLDPSYAKSLQQVLA